MQRLGIDVGGTHTDAVWLDKRRVVASVKAETTQDVESGIVNAVTRLLSTPSLEARTATDLGAVMLGTTHFTIAVVERCGLSRIGAIRIGLPTDPTSWCSCVAALDVRIINRPRKD